MTFPRRWGGCYERQVRDLLWLLAALRDLGLSVEAFMPPQAIRSWGGWGTGYDPEAVDRALAGLGYTPEPGHPSFSKPWHWYGPGGGRGREARAARQQFEQDQEARWASVADLPGPHLRWMGPALCLCGDAGFSTSAAELRCLVTSLVRGGGGG